VKLVISSFDLLNCSDQLLSEPCESGVLVIQGEVPADFSVRALQQVREFVDGGMFVIDRELVCNRLLRDLDPCDEARECGIGMV
jgi:hypothetical protein